MVGEALGTAVLVFFGCGSVATAVLTSAQVGIFQVAIVWGVGIALAIQLTSALSGAHLNPAVTLALASSRRLGWVKVPHYLLAQLAGAIFASAVLHGIFRDVIVDFERFHHLTRGAAGSEVSAMVFAEFFPNPAWKSIGSAIVSEGNAFFVEAVGTAILMIAILGATDSRNRGSRSSHAPWTIGLTVTILISLFGPLTMAAFNPARDLGPRIYAALAGWGGWVFRANGSGWYIVYILAPVVGAQIGALIYKLLLAPAYAQSDAVSSHHPAS